MRAPTTNERDAVIVRSTIERGRNLGPHMIAEGVEDIETWNDLDDIGCHDPGLPHLLAGSGHRIRKWLNDQGITATTASTWASVHP